MKKALTRSVAATVVVPLVLLGVLTFTGSVASAKAKGATPTISCSSLTATITWNPALVPGTATSPTTQITFSNVALTGCTTTPSSSVTAASSVKATASKTTHGNSCSSLISSTGKPTTYTFVITWNGGGGTSKVVFQGSSTSTSPPGFSLANGKATGAFKSKTASATANLDSNGATAITNCVAGSGKSVSSVTVDGGSVSL